MGFQTTMPKCLQGDHNKLRQEYLEEYFLEMRSVLTGRCTPVKPLFTDENGKASDEKLEAVILEIIGECSEKKYKLYHSFFYFALQGIIEKRWDELRLVETFDDVLELITISPAHCPIEDLISLIWSDFKEYDPSWGFFEATRFGCSFIIENHISSLYTPEKLAICKNHFKDSSISNKVDDPKREYDYQIK